MSVAQFAPMSVARSGSRWLLLGSLALNLFFVGVAVAMAVRAPAKSWWDQDVFVRVDRLAATLPQADAALLRADIQTGHDAIETAQADYRAAQDAIRGTLAAASRSTSRRCATPWRRRARRGRPTIRPFRTSSRRQRRRCHRRGAMHWPIGRRGENPQARTSKSG